MRKISILILIMLLTASMVAAQGAKQPRMEGGSEMNEERGAPEGMPEDAGMPEAVPISVEEQEMNQGEATQIRNEVQSEVRTGTFTNAAGKQVMVAEKANNKLELKSGNAVAETAMQMKQEGEKLQVQLSNGKNAEVKVMPDTASEKAIERLKLKVCSEETQCTIELKEVGSGNQTRAAYEVQATKQSKLLGLFSKEMKVQAQVDAENGEVIQSKKPWWAFLASE